MPKVTLYIREDDFEKWKLIKNKSELVSQAINRSIPFNELSTKEVSSNVRPPTSDEDINLPHYDKPPEKNNSVGKPTKKNICPEHLVDKDICRLMKHKGNK